jgi:hypothetical protein
MHTVSTFFFQVLANITAVIFSVIYKMTIISSSIFTVFAFFLYSESKNFITVFVDLNLSSNFEVSHDSGGKLYRIQLEKSTEKGRTEENRSRPGLEPKQRAVGRSRSLQRVCSFSASLLKIRRSLNVFVLLEGCLNVLVAPPR